MPPSFADHLSLLTACLDRRAVIVDAIERQILNVQDKEPARSRDRGRLERLFSSAFASELPRHLCGVYGTLAAAHAGDGFEPVLRDHHSHRLDPADLVFRAYDQWQATRWPGRNGRLSFAQVVYVVVMLGDLERLSLRIWDPDLDGAGARLRDLQRLLDRLNAESSGPVFIRDARWLIQTVQGPLTRDLAPYFRVAAQIAGSFDDGYRLEVHKAGAALAGGHLRSQQRYRAAETGRTFEDPEVLAITRNSNSMDVALLVGDLVALLGRYELALGEDDEDRRLGLADTILQGLAADPDFLVTRLELLEPATMLEEIFIDATAPDAPRLTPAGERHGALVDRYRDLLGRLAPRLSADADALDPAGRAYSPLGISYGFCADVLWNVALAALMARPSSNLSLEDLFEGRTRLDEKRALADAWQHLPTRPGEREHFTHSTPWALQAFADLTNRLRQIGTGDPAVPSGRLFVSAASETTDSLPETVPEGAVNAQEHVVTSDVPRALATGATAFPRSHILGDRREGRYLASVEVDGKWFAVSKVLLTACLARGQDAVIAVPAPLVDRLRLACPGIVDLSSGRQPQPSGNEPSTAHFRPTHVSPRRGSWR